MNFGFAESRNHGNRVRRGNEGTEDQCIRPLPVGQVMHPYRGDGSRQDHSDARQSEDYRELPA